MNNSFKLNAGLNLAKAIDTEVQKSSTPDDRRIFLNLAVEIIFDELSLNEKQIFSTLLAQERPNNEIALQWILSGVEDTGLITEGKTLRSLARALFITKKTDFLKAFNINFNIFTKSITSDHKPLIGAWRYHIKNPIKIKSFSFLFFIFFISFTFSIYLTFFNFNLINTLYFIPLYSIFYFLFKLILFKKPTIDAYIEWAINQTYPGGIDNLKDKAIDDIMALFENLNIVQSSQLIQKNIQNTSFLKSLPSTNPFEIFYNLYLDKIMQSCEPAFLLSNKEKKTISEILPTLSSTKKTKSL